MLYSCDSCAFFTAHHRAITRHLRQIHRLFPQPSRQMPSLFCDNCGTAFSFSGKTNLLRHNIARHPLDTPTWRQRFQANQDMVRMYSEIYRNQRRPMPSLVCDDCGARCRGWRSLRRHLSGCKMAGMSTAALQYAPIRSKFSCDDCHSCPADKERLFIHVAAIHADKAHRGWQQVAESFRAAERRHKTTTAPRVCDDCGVGFVGSGNFTSHRLRAHGPVSFKLRRRMPVPMTTCDSCLEVFGCRRKMRRHVTRGGCGSCKM